MKKSLVLITLIFATACGDDEKTTPTEVETPEQEACEHLAEGPSQSIEAASLATDTLANAALEHTRVDVTLTDYEGAKGGFVNFEADAEGDFLFFMNADIPLSILDGAGNEVAIEATTKNSDLCAEIAVTHTVEFSVGTYLLRFGPTDLTEVGLVHELSGDAHDHAQ